MSKTGHVYRVRSLNPLSGKMEVHYYLACQKGLVRLDDGYYTLDPLPDDAIHLGPIADVLTLREQNERG